MSELKRMDWILSNQGVGSRKEIKKLMKDKQVEVNGSIITDSSFKANPENDNIKVCGVELNYRKYVYIMLNKPPGYVSATYDNRHKTVIDLLPEHFRSFEPFPVGRLDIDTEGLLLITNDGQLSHELLSPKKHVPKKYFVKVNSNISEDIIKEFQSGVVLDDGYKTLPASLFISQKESNEANIIIQEGKFHQIKRMFEAFDYKVTYLKRIQMASLMLDESLNLGDFRELSVDEIENLKVYNLK